MSPATAPPHFIDRGGKPYPYVLTLKGKPLGRNPNRVNPTVFWSSTVDPYRPWFPYSSRNPRFDLVMIYNDMSQMRKGCS